jgi:hypothetical protein
MKRALIVIASAGILAVTVAMESANAQVTRPYVTRPYRVPPPYAEPGSQGAGSNGLGQGHGWNGLDAPRTTNTAPSSNPDSPAATAGGSFGNKQF